MSDSKELQKTASRSFARSERTQSRPTWTPACDIFESVESMTLLADMPGVNEKNIDIRLENGVLTITGRVEDEGWEGYEPRYSEYQIGDYERSFRIADDFDADRIEASLRNGVLRVVLPKSARAKPKKITVQAK